MSQTGQRLPGLGDVGHPASSLLSLSNVTKTFGPTRALKGATLEVRRGDVHCLLGENGAGKSTIGKILAGLYSADSGQIVLDGFEISPASVAEARALGIAIVFQELSLAPHLTVVENISLGSEHGLGFAARRLEEARCRDLLAALGAIDIPIKTSVGTLPVAQQQLIEIAKALVSDPKLIVLDEPTAMLSRTEKDSLFDALRKLRDAGKTFIFVTHHLDEVIDLGDAVSILRDGIVVDSFALTDDFSADDVLTRMGSVRNVSKPATLVDKRNEPFLSVHRSGTTDDLPIEIGKGEIVGLYGVVGCGREELTGALSGCRRSSRFRMTLDGARYAPKDTASAVRHGIAYLATGRAANGILPTLSIRDNLTIGQLGRFSRAGIINRCDERKRSDEQLGSLKVRMRSADDPITSLSGGNQQKVLVGRCLRTAGRLLVLEDPTAGIDLAAKAEIHGIIRSSVSDGSAVLLTSSDLRETLALCSRVYTLFGGRVIACYSGDLETYEDDIVADILGNTKQPSGEGLKGGNGNVQHPV